MADIHDIKWKIDIINYFYLLYFFLLAIFFYIFYLVLSKFFWNDESKKIEKFKDFSYKDIILEKINVLEVKLKTIKTKDFYFELNDVFSDFLNYKYKKDFREKTQRELKKIVSDEKILKFYDSFYYNSFMEDWDLDYNSKKDYLDKFKLII